MISRHGSRFTRAAYRAFIIPVISPRTQPTHNMDSTKRGLWKPSDGIRFGSGLESKSPYSQLDPSRFISASSVNSAPQVAKQQSSVRRIKSEDGVYQGKAESLSLPAAMSAITLGPSPSKTDETLGPSPSKANGTLGPSPSKADGTAQDEDKPVVSPTPHETPLDFKIPLKLHQAALAKDSADPWWSHTLYRSMGDDGVEKTVQVHYCKTRTVMEEVIQKHFCGEKVLGFDMEWDGWAAAAEDSVRKMVSLVQFASPGHIGLFHLAVFKEDDDKLTGPLFRSIMQDLDIAKVGVNILADCTRLATHIGVQTQGVIELSHMHNVVKHGADGVAKPLQRRAVKLEVQAKEHLLLPLYKDSKVRQSRWTNPLTPRQVKYSAADAYAGLQLYYVLEAKRTQLNPTPFHPAFAELKLPLHVEFPPDPLKDAKTKAEAFVDDKGSLGVAVKADISALTAYYLWHDNLEMDPEAIRNALSDPATADTEAVMLLVLSAVLAETMPFDKDRMKTEIIVRLDDKKLIDYHSILKECDCPLKTSRYVTGQALK